MRLEEEWAYRYRLELQRRYGAGTYVAAYDDAVIDWGPDPEAVQVRAEALVGANVFVGPASADSEKDPDWMHNAFRAEIEDHSAYIDRKEAAGCRRRYRVSSDNFREIANLDITCRNMELFFGVVTIDGVERRFSDHD